MRFLLLVVTLLLAACGNDAPKANVNIGSIAPTFQTFRTDGGATHFPAAYFGKPLVVRFWADWCKYCEGEMKAIEAVYQRHKGKGLEVLAINAGQDKATGLQALLDHLGLAAADCVAVGDGPNDAGMLALAGRSYCMADGMKTAKAAAKALAPAAAPDGIAQLCRSLWPEIFR